MNDSNVVSFYRYVNVKATCMYNNINHYPALSFKFCVNKETRDVLCLLVVCNEKDQFSRKEARDLIENFEKKAKTGDKERKHFISIERHNPCLTMVQNAILEIANRLTMHKKEIIVLPVEVRRFYEIALRAFFVVCSENLETPNAEKYERDLNFLDLVCGHLLKKVWCETTAREAFFI